MKAIRSLLNLGVREITTKTMVFVSVNWKLLGASWFFICLWLSQRDFFSIISADVAKFFQPSIDCVVEAIMDQKKSSGKDLSVRNFAYKYFEIYCSQTPMNSISFLLEALRLVIGSSKEWRQFWQEKASSWYVPRITCEFELICHFNQILIGWLPCSNKAVSDGAISFYLDHYVRSRVAKVTYGYKASILYIPSDSEHIKRNTALHTHADGFRYLHDGFRVVLPKVCPLKNFSGFLRMTPSDWLQNTQVSETKEFAQSNLTVTFTTPSSKSHVETQVMCYRGTQENPEWTDIDPSTYFNLIFLFLS